MMLGLGTRPGPSPYCAEVALACLPPKRMVYFPNPFPDQYAECDCQDNPLPYIDPSTLDSDADSNAPILPVYGSSVEGPITVSVCQDCSSLTSAQFEEPSGDRNCCGTHPAGYILGTKPATLALIAAAVIAAFMLLGGRR